MEPSTGKDVLAAVFSDGDLKKVPGDIVKKLERYIGEKFDELITARALQETKSHSAVQTLTEIQTKYAAASKQNEELVKKLENASSTIEELENQLSYSVTDVTKLQGNLKKLEQELGDLRKKRDEVTDERDEKNRMVDRRNAELERLQKDIKALNQQFEEAVAAKCDVLAKVSEVDSMKLSLELKEKRMEQQHTLINKQLESITEELDQRTEELLNMRRDTTSRCVQLEIKLSEKSQELCVANESIKQLTEANAKLLAKSDELLEKITDEKDTYSNSLEAFQQEVDAQRKVAELYKSMNADQTKHSEELAEALKELKEKLDYAVEKYGDLETKHKESELANEEIITKKNECIAMLKKELETANEILSNTKHDSLQREIDEISPNASAASRLIKSGMTMTEIYSQYVNVSDMLAQEKAENTRLQSYVQAIIQELEEKGPLIAKQREHYERALETINEMTKQAENLINENQHLRDTNSEFKRIEITATRENARLKKEVTDLSRQVCHLLREVEHSRAGSSSNSTDQDLSDSTCSADIITKRLVTFNDIEELQSKNQRLIALVRELSTKQEEAELMDTSDHTSLKMKLEQLSESHADLLEQQEKQSSMVKMLIEQRDTYKTMYHQFMKGNEDIPRDKDTSSPKNHEEPELLNDKIVELEQALEKSKKQLEQSNEELQTYRKEKSENEKILVEQMDKMRGELQELMRQNSKLCAKCETTDAMLKVHKQNIVVYKNQVERLEERNRIYSESIVKHETGQSYLNNQILDTRTKLSKAEVMLANLQKENTILRESDKRASRERESLQREHRSHTLMQTNIELIKATLERNDAESRIRLEESLKEAHRECAALRRRLQEEQDNFKELTEHMEKQVKTAQERLQEEKVHSEKLRADVAQAREDVSEKSVQIEELSKKLKNSLLVDLEGSVEMKKNRELQQLLNDAQSQIESLQQKLKISKDAVNQHCNVAQAAEKQLIDLNQKHETDKATYEKKVAEQDAKITDLEEKCSELQGELSLQSDGQVSVTSGLHSRLSKLEIQNKVAVTELSEAKEQLEAARAEIKTLSDNLELAENKYSREVSLHSADLQALRSVKEDLNKLVSEVNEIKHARDRAIEALEENKASQEVRDQEVAKSNEKFESRLHDLDKQNAMLLDQLQELNSQLTVMQTQLSDPQNKSIGDLSFNRSFNEDDVKSSDQLLKIIKYLRQEKDIAVGKCEILDAEHTRMKSQHELLQKQLDEAKATIEANRQESESSQVTAAKHAEVLRKVATLNAITDSNRSLRIERDELSFEVKELRARTANLEEQLLPLQEKNNELQKKAEAMSTENITLRGEATRWRQRANILIEKSNRTSPEDWKKLQNERETLAKQLTIEKANTTKLTEDINNLTKDKARLEDQVRLLKQHQDQQKEDLDKLSEELGSLRTQVSNLTQDLDQSRNQYIRMNEENRVLTENLGSKETALVDVKNNLTQIRKIAKKYKTQAEEQTKEIDALKSQLTARESMNSLTDEKKQELIQQGRAEFEARIAEMEATHTERVGDLSRENTRLGEECDTTKKSLDSVKDSLQTSLEKEEKFKVLFKNAKDRIMALTEINKSLSDQIAKSNASGSSEEMQASVSSADLERCQKEKDELVAEKQQEKERLLQEIDTLTQRVTQLQRQLGQQQGSKPSTSSEKEKSTTEPPTANIKPMAGHSTNTQTQSVPIQPWRSGGEPPLASIRPMSMQPRTAAVLPTSQSQNPSTVMVPPQQQVHTTANSGIEAMSSSPTSSHTDYVPATSSASSAMLGPRQVSVPPTQSNQDTEDDDNGVQMQQAPQQQAVALVMPRVEPPSPAQEQGTSSSSSNTVTTTQAGHKRPREADTESPHEEPGKTTQQPKRTRVLQGTSSGGAEGSVSESGLEVEYQVPTSSQRDHEEDVVLVVESDEEGPDEGEGEDYNMPYEDPDTQDPDQDDEVGNEVEVIEDSSEVPNQSERGEETDMQADGEEEECEAAEEGEEEEVMQPEATSSGTNVSTSVAVTLPSFSRTRQVAPLSRQQQNHLLLPHGLEEGGDDGIVPSTPTLFVARRCDGFGEAVSSPHVPTAAGRFTFSETAAPQTAAASNDGQLPEQTLETSHDDSSTGRSVPSTPLQTSPHEAVPGSDEQPIHQGGGDIPSITVSGAEDEAEPAEGGDCMGPPSVAGTSSESNQPTDQGEDMQEGDDGVSSEGEKAATSGEGEEEGREAEASPSTNTRMRSNRGSSMNGGRRQQRGNHLQHARGLSRSQVTPIVWGDQNRGGHHRQDHRRGGMGYSPRTTTRRNRARPIQRPYTRF